MFLKQQNCLILILSVEKTANQFKKILFVVDTFISECRMPPQFEESKTKRQNVSQKSPRKLSKLSGKKSCLEQLLTIEDWPEGENTGRIL